MLVFPFQSTKARIFHDISQDQKQTVELLTFSVAAILGELPRHHNK